MANRLDYYTLNWVKPEIDEALNQARIALEAHVERGEADALDRCAEMLHQAWGALSMLDLAGPAALVQEMEAAARALKGGAESGSEPLMRALLSLPDYLGGVQQGGADHAVVLGPLVNELRAARGEAPLAEDALFQPDLSALPAAERPELPLAGRLPAQAQALARQLRPHYQASLAALLRKIDPRRNLQKLAIIADHLERAVERPALRQVFWILSALTKALAEEDGRSALPVPLLAQVERRLKHLAARGEEGLDDDAALQALARGLLFRLANTRSGAAQVAEVRQAFDLPGAEQLAQAQASLSGSTAQLFATVAAVLTESLSRVKDTLDVFVRGADRPVSALAQLGTELAQISDTLEVLGREEWSARVRAQGEFLSQAAESGKRPDDQRLMDVAGALLAVEAALEQPSGPAQERTHGVQRDLLVSVITEAKTDLARAKEAVVYYLSAPHDTSPVKAVPDLLGGVTGSLLMLDEAAAAGLLDACRRYIRDRLLGSGAPPPGAELDSLADAVASIEYYLEALGEGWNDPDSILDVARTSVEGLGYPPVDLDGAALGGLSDARAKAADDSGEEDSPSAPEPVATAPEPAATAQTVAAPAAPVPASATAAAPPPTRAPMEELDLEIAEIFCEEAEEELGNIARLLPAWRDNPQDMATLRDLRRCFHTLKGSGRLVGASGVGEFAWAFENMLNRVTDGTLPAHPVMFELIEQARAMLPALLAEFSEGAAPPAGADTLAARAEAVARGELPPDGAQEADGDADVFESDEAPEDTAEPVAAAEPPAAADAPHGVAAEGSDPVEDAEAFAELDLSDLEADFEVVAPDAPSDVDGLDELVLEASEDADAGESVDEITLEGVPTPADEPADETVVASTPSGSDAPTSDDELDVISLEGIEVEEPAPAIDPVLLDIYSKESAGHLEDLRTYIGAARSTGGAQVSDALVRALHTLHGSSRTAQIEHAAELSGQLERYAKLAQAQRAPMDTPALDLLQDAVDFINDTVSLLGVPGASLPDRAPLLQRVEAAIARLKPVAQAAEAAEAAASDFDPELVDIFLEEGAEILERLEGLLQQWRGAPDNLELIEGLQRELHTLKGSARMVGVTPTGDLSHVLESLLAAMTERRVAPSETLIDLVQACQDRLAAQVEQVRRGEPVAADADLVDAVQQVLGAQDVALLDDEPAAPSAPAGEQDMAAAAPPEEPGAEPAPAPQAPPVAQTPETVEGAEDDRRAGARVQHEQVRVRADILDQLVNNAGEVSIYRARLEQQANASRGALDELNETIERLRGQLRRFEIETEAQIQSRFEESSLHQDFDPLEFDRFTEMQQLSRGMLETLNDLDSLRGSLVGLTRETETLLLQQARVNTELQEKLMRTRMVPFGTQAPRLRRIVRQTATELGKRAELQLPGGGGELDRAVLERMLAPIEHMLRNAVAHGIEAPQERRTVGKPEVGTITIRLAREGSEVVMELADDGAGFDLDAIRRKAVERGLMVEGADLTQDDIMQFVLESGFSTAQDISQVAGRGVGMDVVNSQIKQLGGTLQIESTRGQGTRFTVRLPLTLSVTRALMVNVGEEQFAIPLLGIESIVRVSRDEVEAFLADEGRAYEWLGQDYRFMHLGNLMGFERVAAADERAKLPLLLVRSGEHRAALLVDSLIGSRETVVKSVGPQLSTLRGISGATILGDGSVVLILDLAVLIRHGLSTARPGAVAVREEAKATVMVVDDSITVRRVTARLLERHNMQVVTAKDGVEALALLAETVPDVMLLDIEMPRMDGYELASHMRNQERLAGVPIVMITSRTGDKHRERAMSLGVDRYMGKPYQEGELLDTIGELLREGRRAASAGARG